MNNNNLLHLWYSTQFDRENSLAPAERLGLKCKKTQKNQNPKIQYKYIYLLTLIILLFFVVLVYVCMSSLMVFFIPPFSTASYEVLRSGPPHLGTYSNYCQVCSVQLEHSILNCVERRKQYVFHYINDLTSLNIYLEFIF